MTEPTDSKLVVQPLGLQVDLLKCSRASRHWVLSLGAEVHRLREEVDRLEAIIAKLPKTADGVSVVPDSVVWYWEGRRIIAARVTHISSHGWFRLGPAYVGQLFNIADISDAPGAPLFYSTREAAEAAKEE